LAHKVILSRASSLKNLAANNPITIFHAILLSYGPTNTDYCYHRNENISRPILSQNLGIYMYSLSYTVSF